MNAPRTKDFAEIFFPYRGYLNNSTLYETKALTQVIIKFLMGKKNGPSRFYHITCFFLVLSFLTKVRFG